MDNKDVAKRWFKGSLINTDTEKIYSKHTKEIIQDIQKVQGKKMELCTLLLKYHETPKRDFIQKYAEIEITDYNSKLGKIAYVSALFALIISPLQILISTYNPQYYEQHKQVALIFIIIFTVLTIFLIVWIIKIPNEKNVFKDIINAIEDDKLNMQNEETKTITQEIEVHRKELNVKIEKSDSNLSISAGR